ncbi:mitotic spindle assembly checkpoint protein MAD1 [Protopterus annectens]|uniref:mitotic spindle assembly checkpoint protein MAD1 n=1 Tax=Protopterus annectens TaxID=7888 RepID=UPI001CF9BAFA|nr:mitotic spindle assembly checkpoint protein MAD1 [Protopterus annectens]
MWNVEEFDNTAVFSTLRTFNNFINEPDKRLPGPGSVTTSMQQQYQLGLLQLEEKAQPIRSNLQLLQVEREKQQMELSHKRARIELEKEAAAIAGKYEHEVDRNQELHTQIRQLKEKEAEAEAKLKEQLELNKTFKKNMDVVNKKLMETETKLSEANEMVSVQKAKCLELQQKLMNQELQVMTVNSEKQQLEEQLEIQCKKWQEATEMIQKLQAEQAVHAENEQMIKYLKKKLASQETDCTIAKNMRADIARLPGMEKELKQLREENAYYREMKENSDLLQEQVESLQRKLERNEKMKEELVAVELERGKLLEKLKNWEDAQQKSGLEIRTPEELSREIMKWQQRELTMKQQNCSLTSNVRALEKARQQLQNEVAGIRAQMLEEQKKREQQDSLVRLLQKRLLLLTKERDGMRAILQSYDSELNGSDYSPQLICRAQEAEEMVLKVQTHNSELEVLLSQALDNETSQKLRAEKLEMELNSLKSNVSTVEKSRSITKEEMDSLRLKIEELESERAHLEQENESLKMSLERLILQGAYNPAETKVIHMRMNPLSQAKLQRAKEVQSLKEDYERLMRNVESGGGATQDQEGAIPHLPSSQEVTDLRKQLESAELKNQRLKEVFQKKIQEFRAVCYTLTGYQIDLTTENQYRLTSMYAEQKEDSLLFKASSSKGGKMQLLETDFSRTLRDLIELHLLHQNSIPAFLSAVTLDLFGRQTFA